MSFEITFPEPELEVTVETELMKRTAKRTLQAHLGSPLVVWTGPSRNGKTYTARWLVRKIDEKREKNPTSGFRAIHYEVGSIGTGRSDTGDMKRGIRSLHHAAIGRLADNVYRNSPPEALAQQVVHGLRTKQIQMILVDEAGLLSLDAIRGMVLVRDVAESSGWPLSLVFIGMDDLPQKISALPQIKNRVHAWVYFQPYSVEETHAILAALHPHFDSLDLERPEHWEQVEFIHQQYQGLPGLVVPFLRQLRAREEELGMGVDITLLRAVHLMAQREETAAMTGASEGYAVPEPDPRAEIVSPRSVRRKRAAGAHTSEER